MSETEIASRKLARQRVNVEVRLGRLPHPNDIRCTDCAHAWSAGERRHEYDHHLGYAPENHLTVQAVCTTCHAKRDSACKNATHCINGHEFTSEMTIVRKNGTRACRVCYRIRDAKRRPAEFWRQYRAKRKAAKNG